MASQAFGINRARIQQAATKVDSSVPVKRGCLAADLRVAGAHAAKSCASSPTTNEDVAVGIHIDSSVYGPIWNIDRRLPGDSAVCGALESYAAAETIGTIVDLVLEAVPQPAGLINREPRLVAARASIGRLFRPGLTAIGRTPQVVTIKRLCWPGGLQA